ncbi:MAG: MFS transporter [Desulfobacterales bacterium]|nr:MFS transporter [Desulfobacterales bacterium]
MKQPEKSEIKPEADSAAVDVYKFRNELTETEVKDRIVSAIAHITAVTVFVMIIAVLPLESALHGTSGVFLASSLVVFLCIIFFPAFWFFRDPSLNEKKRWDYISAYPQLICSKHFLKPSLERKMLIYYDVYCRAEKCSQDEFMTGIKQVTGLIGTDTLSYREGDRFYANLWSEKTKTAGNADIDVLEIRDTGVSYDYAINAVLTALKNDASRPGGYVKQIPVIICGNPPIPEGAKAVLEHEFGKIETRL